MQPNHTLNQVITKQTTYVLRFNTDQSHISLQLANEHGESRPNCGFWL